MILRSLAVFITSGLLNVSMADTAVVGGDTEVFTQKTGQEIYDQVCISCHMAGGKGAEGAGKYPARANNPKLAAAGYPIFMVMVGNKGMPGLGGVLNDEQIAEVVNYIRTHFGDNYTDKVTAKDVAAQRPKDHQYFDLN